MKDDALRSLEWRFKSNQPLDDKEKDALIRGLLAEVKALEHEVSDLEEQLSE